MPETIEKVTHTPTPWEAVGDQVQVGRGRRIGVVANLVWGDREVAEANARRIAAAVNACDGIPTEMLERLKLESVLRQFNAMRS